MPSGLAKKAFAVYLGLFSLMAFAWPFAADAGCCRCAAGDFTVPYCFKTDKNCHELENRAAFPNLAAFQCSNSLNEGNCRKISEGGICREVNDANTYKPPSDISRQVVPALPAITPELGVAIPGLTFASNITPQDGRISLPFIGQYVSGFYRYITGAIMVVTAVMLVYGGFLYILGSTMQSISRGKAVITDALVGLVIFLSSMLLLQLVNPRAASLDTIGIRVAGRNDAMSNPLQEKQRVEEYATAKPQPADATPVDIPEPAPEAQTPTTTQPATPQPQPAGGAGGTPAPEPPVPEPPIPGKVVKDAYGNNVAQGDCPPGMLPILYSEEYTAKTKKNVPSFCMDIYEAPNRKGEKPIRGAHEWEAEWYCQERGKRLCTYSEWVRACLGPKAANTYGYGPTYIEGRLKDAGKTQEIQGTTLNAGSVASTGKPPAPCNYDSNTPMGWKGYENVIQRFNGVYKTNRKPEMSILNPKNPILTDPEAKVPGCNPNTTKLGCLFKDAFAKYQAEINKFDGSEPSGARPGCVTAEGIFDMTGNVAEMVVKDSSANMAIEQRVAKPPKPKSYEWAGYNWSPIPHLFTINGKSSCNYTAGGVHGAGDDWRDYINGFRCCMGLQP